ncbi:MAG: nucleoside-diphosphate sugar epimerase/dehydratase [Anaerohalosphaeraceae bacterium]
MPDKIGKQDKPETISGEQPLPKGLLHNRKTLIILAHIIAFTAALALAFLFMHSMQILRRWAIYPFPIMLVLVLPIKLFVFGYFKQYRGWWRYVGVSDLLKIAKASLISAIILIALWYAYGVFGNRIIPESVLDDVHLKITVLEQQIIASPTDQEAWEYRCKHANLQGLRDLLEVSRINELSAHLAKISQDSEEYTRLYSRKMQLRDVQTRFEGVIMLDLFTTIMLLSAIRMVVRLYHEEFFTETRGTARRFLIVGAGNAGEALLREMMRRKDAQYEVVGFVDDDPNKQGSEIHGISVLGSVDKLPMICRKEAVDEIAIAIPSANRKQLRRVVQVCQGTKIRFSTVPSLTDIASGKFRVSQMRDVEINDLLGRDVIQLDMEQIRAFLANKVILVTGAGGSIGSEMCRQVCGFGPKKLLLLEQAENPLFFIERELQQSFGKVPLIPVIADITDRIRIEQFFAEYRPQVVIHAAAHKHVPLMEQNPGEAIKNNVIGTRTIADAADKFGAECFVMISTDKAVNPTSIMGSSKRVAEMYIQDLNKTSKTHFVTVRFGNVLGSNGSVVPIFKQQIAAGGPVTVTHPEMRRYFMTIPEASQLVLQAAAMGEGGEIFVLDMGEPVKIVDLAREIITLSGFRPGEDIEIEFSGLRPGEKLFEELSIEGENMLPTNHPKIAVWKNIPKDRQTLRVGIEKLLDVAHSQNRHRIVETLKELVPEFIGQQ